MNNRPVRLIGMTALFMILLGCQVMSMAQNPAVTVIYLPVTVTPGEAPLGQPAESAHDISTTPVRSPEAALPDAPASPSGGPTIGGCPIFPADSIWNTPVDALPVHSLSDRYIASIGADVGLHPDFGSGLWEGGPIGIPYTIVPAGTAKVEVSIDYADESDTGPFPIPPDALIEGGPQSEGDRHILLIEQGTCRLIELYAAYPQSDGSWEAGSVASWDLNSHALRPDEWTSADAAGLPILPGLVRHEEVAAGEIKHAIRFTAEETQRAYVWPARHYASDITDSSVPPMGTRFRLKASFDINPYPPEIQVILRAMQRYGIILADNGSSWFFSGVPHEGWNNELMVDTFREIQGSNFEAVDVSSLMIDPDSGQARQ